MDSMLADPTAPYRLCNHGRMVGRKVLARRDRKLKEGVTYLFVVPLQKDIVLFYPNIVGDYRVCDGQGASEEVLSIRKKNINHTNLAWDRVRSAGEFKYTDGKIHINNKSGHFLPESDTLSIPQSIMERLGYTVIVEPYKSEEIEDFGLLVEFQEDDFSKGDWGFGGKRKSKKSKKMKKSKRKL